MLVLQSVKKSTKQIYVIYSTYHHRKQYKHFFCPNTLAAPHFFYAHLFILFKGCKIWHLTISLSVSLGEFMAHILYIYGYTHIASLKSRKKRRRNERTHKEEELHCHNRCFIIWAQEKTAAPNNFSSLYIYDTSFFFLIFSVQRKQKSFAAGHCS